MWGASDGTGVVVPKWGSGKGLEKDASVWTAISKCAYLLGHEMKFTEEVNKKPRLSECLPGLLKERLTKVLVGFF